MFVSKDKYIELFNELESLKHRFNMLSMECSAPTLKDLVTQFETFRNAVEKQEEALALIDEYNKYSPNSVASYVLRTGLIQIVNKGRDVYFWYSMGFSQKEKAIYMNNSEYSLDQVREMIVKLKAEKFEECQAQGKCVPKKKGSRK